MILRLKSASVLAAACLLIATARGQPYVEDSINVYHSWVGSMCHNSTADVVYGASEEGVIFAISCSLNQIISRVYAHGPLNITYDATDNKAYCSVYNDVLDSVLVIDGATHTRLRAIPLDWATDLVWDSTDDHVWVTLQETDEVACIDCATDSVIARVPVGDCPLKLHLNSRHRKLYVLNNDGESVTIVDIAENRVLRTIPLGNVPTAGCFSEAAGKYYCGIPSQVTVLDGEGDTIIARISLPLGTSVNALAAVESNGLVVAATMTGNSDSVLVIDVARDSVINSVAVGGNPRFLAVSPRTGLLYCAEGTTRSVSVLAGDGSRLLSSLSVSRGPSALQVAPRQSRLYVGHSSSPMVYVIRDSATGVGDSAVGPSRYGTCLRATPNPFSGTTAITWSGWKHAIPVLVRSLDGRLVARLKANVSPGVARIAAWNGKGSNGQATPPGVYFAEVDGNPGMRTKLVKLK
jgi:YVTN family beta-propeller protein